jgi:hypothetical protein
MPSGRLTEKYVQSVAVNWAANYYQQNPDIQIALPHMEVRVSSKSRLGRGQADGLIVAQLLDGTIYTISLEAKSSKSRRDIRLWYKDGRWFLHAVLMGGIGLVMTGVIAWSVGGWFWMWIFPLLAFIVMSFAYLAVTLENSHYRSIDVINQVKRYPANEKWIAMSTDAYNLLKPEERKTLRKDCRSEGIGLMRISAGEKVNLLESPVPQDSPTDCRDFLECYARAEAIRRELEDKSREITEVPG